jgi:hypothetical protein
VQRHKYPQVNVRLSREYQDLLDQLVEEANAIAREAGLPATITSSTLIKMWVQQRLDQHRDPDDAVQVRHRPNVTAARKKLRR